MIEKLQLQDRTNAFICWLDYSQFAKFTMTEGINGIFCLDLIVSSVHANIADLTTKYNRIMYFDSDLNKWYEFSISSFVQGNMQTTIYCEHAIYDTLNSYIDFVSVTGRTVMYGLIELLETAIPISSWVIGTSDISGSFYMQRSKCSLKEAIYDWAAKVDGELIFDIQFEDNVITRTINIYQHIGTDRGVVLYDDREITDFSVNAPVDDYYTAAYGYGAIENEIQLTFESIEWDIVNDDPTDKPLNQKYVTLGDELKERFGFYANGDFQHRFTKYENTEQTDATELLTDTYSMLINNLLDKMQYAISAADLQRMGYEVGAVMQGDDVGIVLDSIGIRKKTRVNQIERDYLNPINNDFSFNFNQKYITDTVNKNLTVANQALSRANTSILSRLNSEINAQQAYMYHTVQDGFVTYNAATAETATNVVQIKGGALRIANSKIGDIWDFKTILDGNGLNASYINTGIISGANYEINLDTGIISMGSRVDGTLVPIVQIQSTGLEINGNEVHGVFSNTGLKFVDADDSNIIIAEFTKEGAKMPTAIIQNELRVGNLRIIPDNSDVHKIYMVIND